MRSSEITSGGQEGASGVPGERMQRQGAQRPPAVNLFSHTQQDGLVPTVNASRISSGITEPPRGMGEGRKDREPEDKPALARAMAKRVIEERMLDLKAVYGSKQTVDLHDLGMERVRAFIALETTDYYDDPYDLREAVGISVAENDLRERSEFAMLDVAGLSTQAEIMRKEVGLRMVEVRHDVRGPEIDIYRRLRIKADKILEDMPGRQVADVFTDDDLYRQAFTGMYADVSEFIFEQQRFIREKDYAGMLIALEARDPELRIMDLEDMAASYKRVDSAMLVARARRMWGDEVFEALPPDIRSQLPKLPLR